MQVRNIFIVGSKGIPGSYGGYETFVDKLTEYHRECKKIKYHVSCKGENNNEFEYNNARCFNIKVPNIGAAQAIYYDVMALKKCCDYIKSNNIQNSIVYILACRIGPFAKYFQRKIHKLGGEVYINPDGHEWMRKKWAPPIKKYWKISEKLMIKHCDLVICDSKNIEHYILETYKKYKPKTIYIAYGTETRKSSLSDKDEAVLSWYKKNKINAKEYYLVVGRFVPENNYETMIIEFMKSNTNKDFVLITNVNEKFLEQLKKRTNFDKDSRIKFVGTVYNQELLMKIRENAYAYLHGHEVGGTNPSLLEAMASTELNLLLNVGFNREVAEDGALYWEKNSDNLADLINITMELSNEEIDNLGKRSTKRVRDSYSWRDIAKRYEEVFLIKERV